MLGSHFLPSSPFLFFFNNFWKPCYLLPGIYSSSNRTSTLWVSIWWQSVEKEAGLGWGCALVLGQYLHQFLALGWPLNIPRSPTMHSCSCYDMLVVASSPLSTGPDPQYSLAEGQSQQTERVRLCSSLGSASFVVTWHKTESRETFLSCFLSFFPFSLLCLTHNCRCKDLWRSPSGLREWLSEGF